MGIDSALALGDSCEETEPKWVIRHKQIVTLRLSPGMEYDRF